MADRDGTGAGGAGSSPEGAAPSAPAPAGDPPSVPAAPGARREEAEQDAESPVSEPEPGTSADADMELLRALLSRTLGLGGDRAEPVLDELSLAGVGRFIKSDRSAGIPDFRSPGTGLYSNLQSYNLPYPEAIFEIGFFKKHPEPFFALARELYPGQFKPTVCHYFMRLLQDKGLLLRCYTQNIDTLERVAGLDPELLVEAHGTFFTSHCLRASCRQSYSLAWMRERIFSSLVPKCEKCQGLVKPDIVFFGENLPSRFFALLESDFGKVDLLIIMGTSLQVQPFASLISRVPTNTPRLLINKEKTGQSDPLMSLMGFGGMDFDSDKAYRWFAGLLSRFGAPQGTWPGWGTATAGAWLWLSSWAGRRSWRSWCRGNTRPSTPRAGTGMGGSPKSPRGTRTRTGGAPKRAWGTREKLRVSPRRAWGARPRLKRTPKNPREGTRTRLKMTQKSHGGGSEDPPHSTGRQPKIKWSQRSFWLRVVTGGWRGRGSFIP
ncbi:NAD-dependent protein deacetylase sirtuin-2 isoform X2 [Zonotrichia albicollis]|uniref:NAD-dependent protein deacetylase sirtuin-2 isoform X2 n=1 Tax=Zonotrichia albicollis TaxID=44394 RepID=UPI003D80D892